MKICPNCKYEIIDHNAKYCPECGFLLEDNDQLIIEEDKHHDTSKETLLIDYYEKTIGTPEQMPYYELVLYSYNDKELILEEYIDGGSDKERCIQRLVPFKAYEDALKVVRNFHLKELLNRKGPGLSGKYYVIKFKEDIKEENTYRFSSDNVGKDQTMMMFVEMKRVLSSYK